MRWAALMVVAGTASGCEARAIEGGIRPDAGHQRDTGIPPPDTGIPPTSIDLLITRWSVDNDLMLPFYEDSSRRYETPLHALQLRVGLSPDGINRDGNLGGYTYQTELLQAALSVPAAAPYRDALVGNIAGFVDLATPIGTSNASCESPEGAISVGLGFHTTRIRILSDAPRDRPAHGNCGATP